MIFDRIQYWLLLYLQSVHSARWIRRLKKFPRIHWMLIWILTYFAPPFVATAILLINWLVDLIANGDAKLWFIPLAAFIAAFFANYFIIKRCRLVLFDGAVKILVCVPIPTTNDEETDKGKRLGILGDICLQLAGFQVGQELYSEHIEIEPFSTAREGWTEALTQKLDKMFKDSTRPIWIVVTMSRTMSAVMDIVTKWLLDNKHLKIGRTTVIFTVTSSDFITNDRRTMFRLFVDGNKEAHQISEHINAINHHANLKVKSVLCAVTNSTYGRQASIHLRDRLKRSRVTSRMALITNSSIKLVDKGQELEKTAPTTTVTGNDINEYDAVVLFAYDRDLKSIFLRLKDAGYKGYVIGATTLSVEDWQNNVKKAVHDWKEKPKVFHTAVVGFDERRDTTNAFIKGITKLSGSSVLSNQLWLSHSCEMDEKLKLEFVESADYEDYRKITNNYISAFCAEALRLFSLMKKHEKGTLRELLDCETAADELKYSALIKDVDFGVNGESHVLLTIKVWNMDLGDKQNSELESKLSIVEVKK